MSDRTIIELKNIDPEDISGVLVKVEKSFGLKFRGTELNDVKTFGELCDIITNKIQGDNKNDCTTQEAFYKLRSAISATLLIDKSSITPDSNLLNLFPRQKRRQHITAIENELGFKMKILQPRDWISDTFVVTLLISIIVLFISWKIGLGGLLFSIIGQSFATKFGKEMGQQTVGQLAEKISRENYLKARRHPSTVNRNEIAREVKELFSKDLGLNESFLRREATFD